MNEPWFKNEKKGVIKIKKEKDTYYVVEPETDGETVCIFSSDSAPTESGQNSITVQVRSYRQGIGEGTNYLTVETVKNGEMSENTSNKTKSESSTQKREAYNYSEPSQDTYPERNLIQFSGTGDYVTVEAEILSIQFVEKNNTMMPDMKGVLKEQGSVKKLPFVVSDGVRHPYFKEGKKFRFEGVKDHMYQHKSQVQALITENTRFTEL